MAVEWGGGAGGWKDFIETGSCFNNSQVIVCLNVKTCQIVYLCVYSLLCVNYIAIKLLKITNMIIKT